MLLTGAIFLMILAMGVTLYDPHNQRPAWLAWLMAIVLLVLVALAWGSK